MAKLVNFNEISNKFIDFFYVGKLNLFTVCVFIGAVRCLKYTIQLSFWSKDDIFYRINLFFCEKEGDFWAFFGGFF